MRYLKSYVLTTALLTLFCLQAKADTEPSSGCTTHNYGVADFNNGDVCTNCGQLLGNPNEFRIWNKNQLLGFVKYVNSGGTQAHAIVTADFTYNPRFILGKDSVSIDEFAVGTAKNKYQGVFDGGGHSILFELDGRYDAGEACGLFAYTDGAVIRNLNLKENGIYGGVTLKAQYAGALVGCAAGNTRLEYCSVGMKVSNEITSAESNLATGGLVGYVPSGSSLSVSNCAVTGFFLRYTKPYNSGGILGRVDGHANISNCFVYLNNLTINSQRRSAVSPFVDINADKATLRSCYYATYDDASIDNTEGAWLTFAQLKDGTLLRLLQGDRTGRQWKQTIGTDNFPRFYSSSDPLSYVTVGPSNTFFDTGHKLTDKTRVELDVHLTDESGIVYKPYLIGCGRLDGEGRWYTDLEASSVFWAGLTGMQKSFRRFKCKMGDYTGSVLAYMVDVDDVHVSFGATDTYVAGGSRFAGLSNQKLDGFKTGVNNILIGGTVSKENDAENELYNGEQMKITRVRIYEGDTLVNDFVPTNIASDDSRCSFYDLLNDTTSCHYFKNSEVGYTSACTNHVLGSPYISLHRNAYLCAHCHQPIDVESENFVRTIGKSYINIDYPMGPLTMLEGNVALNGLGTSANETILSAHKSQGAEQGEFSLTYGMDGSHLCFLVDEEGKDTVEYMYPYQSQHVVYTNGQSYSELATGVYNYYFSWDKANAWKADGFCVGADITSGTALSEAGLDIYNVLVEENGEVKASYIPACQEGQGGLLDLNSQKFYPVQGDGCVVYVNSNCQHPILKQYRKHGKCGNHCLVCDEIIGLTYYAVISYDANGGVGVMNQQDIDVQGTLLPNNFSRKNFLFNGWNTRKDGKGQSFGAGATFTPGASLCDSIVLYAQWKNAYTVNGQPLVGIDNNYVGRIDIQDDEENRFGAGQPFKVGTITYTRHDPNNEWGTICLPFATESTSEVQLYTLGSISESSAYLKATDKANAGQPVIYRKNKTAESFTLSASDANVVVAPVDNTTDGVTMTGAFEYKGISCDTLKYKSYAIMGDQFYLSKKSIVLNPYRAYFYTGTDKASGVKLQIRVEDETGINPTPLTDSEVDGYYTLDGMRVSAPTHGVNIIRYKNGQTQKRIIK